MNQETDRRETVGRVEIVRFDGVSPEHDYRGYDYTITLGDTVCRARRYDAEYKEIPVIKIEPPAHGKAYRRPKAAESRDFMLRRLGANKVKFFGDPSGGCGELPGQTTGATIRP